MRRLKGTRVADASAPPRAPRRFRSRTGSQAGELLIETLLTVLLLGSVIATGTMMLLTTVRASMTHQAVTRSSNEATVASEYLERVPYLPCGGTPAPTATNYEASMASGATPYVAPQGLNLSLSVVAVTYLSSSSSANAVFQSSCPASDEGAQKLVVRVEGQGANGPISVRVVFVKRDDRCLGLADVQPGQTC